MIRRRLLLIVASALVASACSPSAASTIAEGDVPETVTTLPPVPSPAPDAPSPEPNTGERTPQADEADGELRSDSYESEEQATTTTESVPIPTPRARLVVSGVGDVNLDPAFVRSFPSEGYEYAWTGLHGAFLRDDLTIVNLECSPSALGSPWNKPWTFRCDPDALPSMAAAGVEIANLANNHSIDFGFEAMLDGMQNLRDVGIAPVGTGQNIHEAYEPFVTEINGWTVAVIGSGGVNPETGSWLALEDRPGMTHGDDTESIAEAVRAAKEHADIVLVTAHWGEQGTRTPRAFERGQAETWIEAGADGVLGHHQHVLQPLEFYRGKPIAWGLGNFVWQAYPALGKITAIAQFVYEPDGRIGACLLPVVIEQTGHPVVQDPSAPVCAPGPQR